MESSTRTTITSPNHESLMGSMMARSTPRVLLHSPVIRLLVTALEILAACFALSLLITLCTLHVRFVRRQGCANTLFHLDSLFTITQQQQQQQQQHEQRQQQRQQQQQRKQKYYHSNNHNLHTVPPIIEIAILSSSNEYQLFRFSQERGLLLLSDTSLSALNISVTQVQIPSSHRCLGDKISRSILQYMIGYDTIIINSFARLRRRIKSLNGYILLTESRRVLNLLHSDPIIFSDSNEPQPVTTRLIIHFMHKIGAIITAVFILCTTAALVTFTLREIQLRIIKLTIDLQLIMRSQLGYGRILIRYATDALVFVPIIAGMLFFLFEFFDDQALAFAVLVITWLCEFAVTGSTRHWISRSYLPKFLFFYFVAFLIYFFSFPLGFSWLSFSTSLSCMVHAALFVWNRFELPVLRLDSTTNTTNTASANRHHWS